MQETIIIKLKEQIAQKKRELAELERDLRGMENSKKIEWKNLIIWNNTK